MILLTLCYSTKKHSFRFYNKSNLRVLIRVKSNQYYEFSRGEMMAFLPDEYSKALEIGCGAGAFIGALDPSTERWGVEQNSAAAKSAATRADKVLIGSFESVKKELPDNYFDLIICNDVIEHIEHHELFLEDLKNKLSNHGSLVVSIPNVRFLPNLLELLFRKDWRYREMGVLDKTHLRFFTRKSLIRSLEDTGWSVEKIRGINRYGNRLLGPKRIISYIGQVIFGFDTAYLQFGARARKK